MASWNPQANELFLEAIEIESADERLAFLDAKCGDDAPLREQVESLLAASQKAGQVLDQPAVRITPTEEMESLTEQPGMQIGPYKLLQQLGEGGMGVVYMAEQKEPVERRVALKIIKPAWIRGR